MFGPPRVGCTASRGYCGKLEPTPPKTTISKTSAGGDTGHRRVDTRWQFVADWQIVTGIVKVLKDMSITTVETLIIGGGQAGLAMSEHLAKRGVSHLIVERRRIAERWRSERWDSLVANGPAWHDRFPGMTFAGIEADSFATKHQIVAYFEAYAKQIAAPIRCGVEVTSLRKKAHGSGFRAETSEGVIEAAQVVVATGPFQRPIIPAVIPADAGVAQMHSSAYRNPVGAPPRGRCWSSARARRVRKLPTNSRARDDRSICRWGRITVRRGAIGDATSYGGWVPWVNGMRRPRLRVRSM